MAKEVVERQIANLCNNLCTHDVSTITQICMLQTEYVRNKVTLILCKLTKAYLNLYGIVKCSKTCNECI